MGVAKTLPNYKSFTFDGTNSRNYGVYITGQGVFNAPERNVEMVEIPGRNGAYALDKGNFNNIEVTYPAGIFADTEADFAQAVSDLRNFLCSKSGYCRLEDDYNSGEYRMAIYKSGLEVTHEMLIAGEFNIVFECKPQRYLTSGETATAVTSGGKVTNPTLFEAKPQLQVWGYGNIEFNNNVINIINETIGYVLLANPYSAALINPYTTTFDNSQYNIGDIITLNTDYIFPNVRFYELADPRMAVFQNATVSDSNNNFTTHCGLKGWSGNYAELTIYTTPPSVITFTAGTSQTITDTIAFSVTVDGTPYTATITINISYIAGYTLTQDAISIEITLSSSFTNLGLGTIIRRKEITVDSSITTIGSPTYIDLDIGEAYNIENGNVVSVNNSVQIPAELPVLPSGDTTITYDNTITQFKVLPRWWKV